jgi:hypothetical protein
MMKRVSAAFAVVALGISVPGTRAHAETGAAGPCADNVGVTVVIDFQDLGGGVNVRCAPGSVTSGLDALAKAGVTWEPTRRSPGFVCRIAGKPGPAAEPCGNTPPATAYWSYWIAPRGGTWCYSTVGPGSRQPPAGSIEGWSFSLNKAGSATPPPGFEPPPPTDGQVPQALRAGDCGDAVDGTATPTSTTTTVPATSTTIVVAATTSTVTPATTAPVTTTTDSSSAVATVLGSTVTAATIPEAAAGVSSVPETASPETTPISTIAPASSVVATTTTPAPSSSSTAAIPVTSQSATTTSSGLGSVDLSDDRRGNAGSGATTAIGTVAAGGIAVAGVWAARRRRAVP